MLFGMNIYKAKTTSQNASYIL